GLPASITWLPNDSLMANTMDCAAVSGIPDTTTAPLPELLNCFTALSTAVLTSPGRSVPAPPPTIPECIAESTALCCEGVTGTLLSALAPVIDILASN